MGNILTFPADDFAPPQRIKWREWARMEIAGVQARRQQLQQLPQAAYHQHLAKEMAGFERPAELLEGPQRDNGNAETANPAGSPDAFDAGNGQETSAMGTVGTGETLMRELNPPLLSADERGQGDSTNAKLHRLLTAHPNK